MKAANVAVAVLLATIGTQSASAPPTMEETLSAYQLHLYGRPVEVLRMHAEQGNAVAQYHLGFMYARGQGGPEDDAEAARWYRLAAEQGNADAQSNLALMYARGEGVAENDAEAVRLARLGVEQGNAVAQFALGACAVGMVGCKGFLPSGSIV